MNAGPIAADGTPVPSAYGPLTWSPDGRKILVAGSVAPLVPLIGWPGPVVTALIDVASASVDWRRQDAASTSVIAAAFAPDGSTITVVTQQGMLGCRLDVLTMPHGALLRSTSTDWWYETVVYAPDSRLLGFSGWYGVRVVETATGAERLLHRPPGGGTAAAVLSQHQGLFQ